MGRMSRIAWEETSSLQVKVAITNLVAGALPAFTGSRLRTAILRAGGWRIGPRSLLFGVPRFYGTGPIQRRLVIGGYAAINIGCTFELNADISLGDHVSLGHDILMLTSSHKLGPAARRAGPLYSAPIHIGSGAWIGSRSVILPGVTIGDGAVVAAGSVVSKDVPANALVSGSPASVSVPRLPGR
jgi:maltose O-acetyltransferase